ncbi:hypothetical protein [Nonomuraea sp. NPDC050783]|uniref:hypothetical protein n=1 Tax=Nonomuraea sp. NPDC050783 TaxID=3154634 RepID=UPI0034658417
MRRETKMHGRTLLLTGPLIAALVLGSTGTSQASIIPAQVSGPDIHVTAATGAVPPVCKSLKKKQKRICANGYSDGFETGVKCGRPRQSGRISDDEAYDIGFTAGFNAGRRTCKS